MEKIFYTLALYPESFDYNYLNQNIMTRSSNLITLLNFLVDRGVLFKITKDWIKIAKNYIKKYEDINYKNNIEKILELLKSKNKLQGLDKDIQINFDIWNKEIKKYNLDFYFATKKKDSIFSVDEINEHIPKESGAIIGNQNEEFIKKILFSIIPFSSEITIFDPYFNINESRYKNFLNIIFKLLKISYKNEIKYININTSIKHNDSNRANWKQQWQNKINNFQNQFSNCKIVINVWEEKQDNKFHDRFLITEIGSFNLGKGADISPNGEYTWGKLSDSEKEKLEAKIAKNNPNSYKFICKIDTNKIEIPQENKKYHIKDIADEFEISLDEMIKKAKTIFKPPLVINENTQFSESKYRRLKNTKG